MQLTQQNSQPKTSTYLLPTLFVYDTSVLDMEPYKNWDSPAWSELDSQGYCIVENAVSKANCKMLREGILGSLSDAGDQCGEKEIVLWC